MQKVRMEIRPSEIAGDGVFALEDIPTDVVFAELTGKRISEDEADVMLEQGTLRADDVFQIQEEEYLVLDVLPVRINHSCEPNAGVRGENQLIALRDIHAGEEITYDYSTVVGADNDGWKMQCHCGSSICRSIVGSVLSISPERLSFYRAHAALPDFILGRI
jgi:SET domain-containing protein